MLRRWWRRLRARRCSAALCGRFVACSTSCRSSHPCCPTAAVRAAVLGRGEPGTYNLAGDGTLTMKDLAGALGWRTLPVPRAAVDALAELVAIAPLVPA